MLRAGCLEMIYDAGGLRYIKAGDEEVLRRIYVALRDEAWGTFTPYIFKEKIKCTETNFFISYLAQYKLNGSPIFRWEVEITGNCQNEIVFSIRGFALAAFKKNRAGLCILHPVKSCAGRSCYVTTLEETVLNAVFPQFIAAHQPFKNIKKMRWTTPGNHTCAITFEGDIFETEDQRNWTDASFKTYSTPLDLPFPVLLRKGDIIQQKIAVSVCPQIKSIPVPTGETRINLTFDLAKPFDFPQIGSCQPRSGKKPDDSQVIWLRKLQLDHYRIDIRLYEATWHASLKRGLEEAKLLETQLKIALHLDNENALARFIDAISDNTTLITAITLLGPSKITDQSMMKRHLPVLKKRMPELEVGGGTDCYFAELNRNPPDRTHADFVSFSINPQVHASDDLTLLENMEAQYDAVVSAQNLLPHLPVHISPITLKPRFNPDSRTEYRSGNMPSENTIDFRQHTIFAAGWTLGSLRNLIAAGAAAITYYETIGDQGILPWSRDELKITLSPVYLLLKLIMEFKKGKIFAALCDDTMKCTGIFLSKEGSKRWIIANHSSVALQVNVNNLAGGARLRELNPYNIHHYIHCPDRLFASPGKLISSGCILLRSNGIAVIDKEAL